MGWKFSRRWTRTSASLGEHFASAVASALPVLGRVKLRRRGELDVCLACARHCGSRYPTNQGFLDVLIFLVQSAGIWSLHVCVREAGLTAPPSGPPVQKLL